MKAAHKSRKVNQNQRGGKKRAQSPDGPASQVGWAEQGCGPRLLEKQMSEAALTERLGRDEAGWVKGRSL